MMKCIRCGGKTEDRQVELFQPWGDKWYFFRDVPADVCTECGEQYFDADVLQRIDEMREGMEQSQERVEIPAATFSKKDKAA